MQSNQTTHGKFVLTTPAVLSLFGVKSNPNPDDPDRPGPWGPVVRRAEDRVRAVLGPSPDPWLVGPDPRWAAFARALAEEVIDRANLMQQIADALPQTGGQHAIIIIGGALKDFTDGCGTGRIRQPFPPPRLTATVTATARPTTGTSDRQQRITLARSAPTWICPACESGRSASGRAVGQTHAHWEPWWEPPRRTTF